MVYHRVLKADAKTCYGYVQGMDSELGYFTLEELEEIHGPLGLAIERDMSFKPTSISTIKDNYHEFHYFRCHKNNRFFPILASFFYSSLRIATPMGVAINLLLFFSLHFICMESFMLKYMQYK